MCQLVNCCITNLNDNQNNPVCVTHSRRAESFHGLPGMILGLAVPRLYTTWFATKVSLEPSKLPEPKFSVKQKKITYEDLSKQLVRLFERWEENAQKYIWWTYL